MSAFAMEEKILSLRGVIENDRASICRHGKRDDDEKQGEEDLKEAAEWLREYLRYRNAVAEYDGRLS